MTQTGTRSGWRRLSGLLQGWFSGWVRDREGSHPRAVYERAIAERRKQYQELKRAVAGVLYMRNKIEAEISERTRELEGLRIDLERAVRRGLDDVALELIRQKEALIEERERSRQELDQVIAEVETAKGNLLRFRSEIHGLEREKVRMLASLANARARRRIQEALDGLSTDAEVAALDNVRAEIARMRFESRLDQELGDDPVRGQVRALREEARNEGARRELAALKERLLAGAQLPGAERLAVDLAG